MKEIYNFCYTVVMSEVLYRKYRPESFADVVGQDHIVSVLKQAIKSGNISHAYLLTGSRGIGKTTIARIIARELGTNVSDIYELDAASHNGVDEIRTINEGVHSLPFSSKYKVYILDEVHMLSKGAFNALLKTLEEPPKHVIFILATTEIEKVPETVLSRCQVFTFKKPNEQILKDLVLRVGKEEGRKIDEDGADLVAVLGDGSFRDTLGILQKVLSSTNEKNIKIEEIESITGAPQSQMVADFVSSLIENEIPKCFAVLEKAVKQNIEMTTFLKLIIIKYRALLLERISGKAKAGTANVPNSKTLILLLEAFSQLKNSVIESLPIEIALARASE